jgi:hypothetical protein
MINPVRFIRLFWLTEGAAGRSFDRQWETGEVRGTRAGTRAREGRRLLVAASDVAYSIADVIYRPLSLFEAAQKRAAGIAGESQLSQP